MLPLRGSGLPDRPDPSAHTVVDLLGLIPVVGEPIDATRGIWYLFEGDFVNAGISAVSMATIFGDFAKFARYGDEAATALSRAPTSAVDDASRAAFCVADNLGSFSVKPNHLPGADGRYNKFDYGVDAEAAIRDALKSDGAQFLANPNLANTLRVVTDLGCSIGTRGETDVRVIVGLDGQVINAFPVKVR